MPAFFLKQVQVLGEGPERQDRLLVQVVHRRQANGQGSFVFAKMPVDEGVCSKDLRVIHMKAHDRL